MGKTYLDMIFEKWGVNIPDMKLEIEDMLGHEWISVKGRRYTLASFGEPFSDGSRRATLRLLKHESYCQIKQQDGDDENCTCLIEEKEQ